MPLGLDTPVDEVTDHLEGEVPRILHERGVPGASVALIRDGQLAWAGAFGVKNAWTGEPATVKTLFDAYSCTKPLLAYRAVKMCEQGAMSLDCPLRDYLDEPLSDDPRSEAITLRMALSHTSGLGDDEQSTILFQPGTRWCYSTDGYLAAQRAIDRVSGVPFAQNVRDNVLAPLGMGESTVAWRPELEARLAQGHDRRCCPMPDRCDVVGDADSLLTTAADYALFLADVMGCGPGPGDAYRPSQEGLTSMVRAQVRIAAHASWGLGWGVQETCAGNCFWHLGGGEDGPFHNFVAGLREPPAGVVILTNGGNGSNAWAEIAALAIGCLLPVCSWQGFDALLRTSGEHVA